MTEKSKTYWQITYTDIRTGCRKTYMNIGFETKESARKEINSILRHKKLYDYINIEELNDSSQMIPSVFIGKNWRIKKVKVQLK